MPLKSLRAVLLVALALPLAAPGHAAARTYEIKLTGNGFVKRLGPLKVQRDPLLRDAERAFGQASSARASGGVCVAKWRSLRLRATFTSFGGASDMCAEGRFQLATVRSKVWRTWKGLRVGMRTARVAELHPSAEFDDGKWVLATQSVYGEPAPTVTALIKNGRVRALSMFVGAAGD